MPVEVRNTYNIFLRNYMRYYNKIYPIFIHVYIYNIFYVIYIIYIVASLENTRIRYANILQMFIFGKNSKALKLLT
ncbi:hypothetical protein CBU03nite_10960 [Clostridium butyricum]|nr:hypothetical protein Cbu04g_26830 [Clostridium butyricum]GEQ24673.1 hypothetical protein CBU03nite_10960 [Clostridium butyricum]